MLTDDEIRSCLRIRKLFCTLNIVPLELNIEHRSFRIQTSSWKRLLSYFMYFHFLFRALFAYIRVCQAIFSGLYSINEPHLFMWDIVMLLASTMYSTWYAIFFIWKPANTIFMLNQAFSVSSNAPTGSKNIQI